jgi:hypothetical protein
MLLQQSEENVSHTSMASREITGVAAQIASSYHDPVAELLSRHAEEQALRKQRTRRMRIWLTAGLAPVWAFVIVVTLHTHKWALLSLLATVAVISATVAATRKQVDLNRELAALDDVRVIGPLIDAMDYGEEDTPDYILAGLARQLPSMKASDAGLLTERHRKILRQILAEQEEKKFTALRVAILKALEQIGDSRDLKTVKSLAHPLIPMTGIAAVRDAARACLPYLETLAQAQRVRDSLLRPSSSIPQDPGVLLRPTTSGTIEDPYTLLRAFTEQGPQITGDPALLQALLADMARNGERSALPYLRHIAQMPALDSSIRDAAQCAAAEIELRHEVPDSAYSGE